MHSLEHLGASCSQAALHGPFNEEAADGGDQGCCDFFDHNTLVDCNHTNDREEEVVTNQCSLDHGQLSGHEEEDAVTSQQDHELIKELNVVRRCGLEWIDGCIVALSKD